MTRTAKWKRSARVIAASIAFVGWVIAGALAAKLGAEMLGDTPVSARLFVGIIAVVFGLGGLCLFWSLAERVTFELRGYRVRQLGPKGFFVWTLGSKDCRYEERTATGEIQSLPFVREILGDGYPAPSRVRLPKEDAWDAHVPLWARGRRSEIVERIREAFRSSVTEIEQRE